MLRFNGAEVVWNDTPLLDLNFKELSCSERFEFLCAISSHDPVDNEMSTDRFSTRLSSDTGN